MCIFYYLELCQCCKRNPYLDENASGPYHPFPSRCICNIGVINVSVYRKCRLCELDCDEDNICVEGVAPDFIIHLPQSHRVYMFFECLGGVNYTISTDLPPGASLPIAITHCLD